MPEAANRLLILAFGLAMALGSAITVRRAGLRAVRGTARGLAPPPRLLSLYIAATPGAAAMVLYPIIYFFWPPVHELLRPAPALAQLGASARVGLPAGRTELVRPGPTP